MGRRRSWSDDDLRAAVAASTSILGVLRALGRKPGGDTYVAVKEAIARLELSTEHFMGQGWRKGNTAAVRPARPLEEVLVKGRPTSTHNLRLRLIRNGVKDARCERCGITEWMERSAPLQLDHINGDRCDNRLENLRILCPNCHSQTDTWCGKNQGRVVELAYTHRSNRCAERIEGSNPSTPTENQLPFEDAS